MHSYKFADKVSRQFFIDEDTEKIYIIRNYVNSDGSEIFAAVSYQLLF